MSKTFLLSTNIETLLLLSLYHLPYEKKNFPWELNMMINLTLQIINAVH